MAPVSEDYLMGEEDEEDFMEEDRIKSLPVPRFLAGGGGRTKGRGFSASTSGKSNSVLAAYSRHAFESLDDSDEDRRGPGPLRSIEGWVVIVTGVKDDAEQDDLMNAFTEFGHVSNLQFHLDRRTGYAKGYVLVEYEKFEEALAAIKVLNGSKLLTKTIGADWAFTKGPMELPFVGKRSSRQRSRSPPERT